MRLRLSPLACPWKHLGLPRCHPDPCRLRRGLPVPLPAFSPREPRGGPGSAEHGGLARPVVCYLFRCAHLCCMGDARLALLCHVLQSHTAVGSSQLSRPLRKTVFRLTDSERQRKGKHRGGGGSSRTSGPTSGPAVPDLC